jgi:hypothetical protein
LPVVFAPPHHVSGVITRQNLSSAHSSAYSYYEGHSSDLDTSSSLYYLPVTNYDQHKGKEI